MQYSVKQWSQLLKVSNYHRTVETQYKRHERRQGSGYIDTRAIFIVWETGIEGDKRNPKYDPSPRTISAHHWFRLLH